MATTETRRKPADRPTTIMDIARHVGVTDATVSNVLNGKGRTSESMRERVLAAAKAMNYSSNSLARGLKTGRTYTIGVLANNLDSPLTAYQLSGVDRAARGRGYNLLITTSDRYEMPDPRSLLSRGIDGIVAVAASADVQPHLYETLRSTGLPYVYSYRAAEDAVEDDEHVGGCVIDQEAGGALAAQRLLAIGRRRVAFAGGPRSMRVMPERLAGFRSVVDATGLHLEEDNVVFGESFGVMHGMAIAERFLDRRPMPDAIFAGTDELAFGIMRVCRRRGVRVPDDIAVIGFNDLPYCDVSEPALTSIRMPLADVGGCAVGALIDYLENRPQDGAVAEVVSMVPTLVVRESA